jgi:hypothetical protein
VTLSFATIFRDEMRLPVKLGQRVNRGISNQDYITTMATISTSRTPARKKCLSYESHLSVSTVTGSDFYYCGIKHVENQIKKFI